MTSHDVVAVARRCLNTKKIGHCGTLDPMATGMLILVIGNATRIQDLLMSEDKEYTGTARLGATTSTQDREGRSSKKRRCPPSQPSRSRGLSTPCVGISTRHRPWSPPSRKTACRSTSWPGRQGDRARARLVHVFDYELTRVEVPEIDFRVVCSKGFYVRTYAHDVGQHLGCGAHLSALRRTRSGHFTFQPGKFTTFDVLKEGRRDEALAAMYSLYDVSKLRGA
ncbi:tRNA pseudouridine(55) synthase TruB [Verrucomicrobium spinosum]|uniref:tRNA pseudouridine(55) synthase TruB n=1 Tax=Verrucomicrobium spinosum TaxID=2736 RepID=UPI003CCE0A1D